METLCSARVVCWSHSTVSMQYPMALCLSAGFRAWAGREKRRKNSKGIYTRMSAAGVCHFASLSVGVVQYQTRDFSFCLFNEY